MNNLLIPKQKIIRPKVERDIKYIIYLMVIAVLTALAIMHYQYPDKPLLSPLSMRAAFADGQPLKIPTLNPNITERQQNQDLIRRIWGSDSWIGLNIARCESGYRTTATNQNTNGTVDQGVFQINSVHGMPEMNIAVANIAYAYVIFKEQGTNPWYSSRACWNIILGEK